MSVSRNCVCASCGKRRIPERLLKLEDGTRVDTCFACRHPAEAKTCKKCSVAKPLDSFYAAKRPDQVTLTYTQTCKECVLKRNKQPEFRKKRLAQRYGLTIDQYDALIEAQDNRCAGCGASDPGTPMWQTDHDHACCPGERSCGECVRGLLCRDCNLTLGHARDSADRLLGLALYLETSKRHTGVLR